MAKAHKQSLLGQDKPTTNGRWLAVVYSAVTASIDIAECSLKVK